MGEARRRRLLDQEVNRVFAVMHREGQGVLSFEIFPPEQQIALIGAAILGAPKAVAIVRAVIQMVKDRGLCLLCDYKFSLNVPPPHTVLVLRAARDDASAAMVNGICHECGERHSSIRSLKDAVLAKYRALAMPEVRELDVMSQAGRA